jgi:hypothetical protein
MAIRVTDSEMTSDVCSAHAVKIAADSWMVGPAEVFGPASRELLFSRDQATTAMVLGELTATGLADSDRYRRLAQRYRAVLGLGE